MPVVEVKMWDGRDTASKRKIIQGITEVFVSLGVPANAVTVILTEYPKSNWGEGGTPAG
ncbi:MAG: tautomerase family protein [Candidatus Bathyarchaeota archaeon]